MFKINKKDIFLYVITAILIVSILLIGIIIFYNKLFGNYGYTTDEYKENLKKIEAIQLEKEEIINNDYIDDEHVVNSFTGLISAEMFSGLNANVTLEDLKSDYTNAYIKGDTNSQLLLLEQIYHTSNDVKYLYPIISTAKDMYNFEKAFAYSQIVFSINNDLGELSVDDFFSIMLNHLEYNTDNLNKIKAILKILKDTNKISITQYNYYNSVLSLVGYDMDSFYSHFSGISKGNYESYKQGINDAISTYESYKDVPQYYLKSLMALVLFQQGLLTPAEKISFDVLKENSRYILPNQILANASFLKSDYTNAKKYFTKLITEDPDNSNIYRFYLGISHYWGEKYEEAIIFFSQVKSGGFQMDAVRYLISSYYNIGDYKNVVSNFQKISKSKHLTEYDYYTFFDMFFYKPFETKQSFTMLKSNSKLALEYISTCQKNLGKNMNYICLYGKGGYLLAKGAPDKSLKYLNYLIKYYPRNYMFKAIGDIYESRGEMDKAKKSYINAVLSSQLSNEKSEYKKILIEFIVDSKN
ncbi:MAG: hypothetical protein V3575_03810 [Candidatus Absconditabacteria bacterium]